MDATVSAASPTFTEVALPIPTPAARWGAELQRPDGTTLRLAPEVSSALLRQLLRAW